MLTQSYILFQTENIVITKKANYFKGLQDWVLFKEGHRAPLYKFLPPFKF